MNGIQAGKELWQLDGFDFRPVSGHEGGRNRIWICTEKGEEKYIMSLKIKEEICIQNYI